MIEISKAIKAINIANKFERAEVDLHTSGSALILVFGDDDARIDKVLEEVPRLKKYVVGGNIWARGNVDAIEIRIATIGQCKRVERTILMPEMIETGKMIEKTVVDYECDEQTIGGGKR